MASSHPSDARSPEPSSDRDGALHPGRGPGHGADPTLAATAGVPPEGVPLPEGEVPDGDDHRGLFGAALRVREFRALWIADTLSVLGTQVSRVCLSLLVYDQTGSAAATALIYALTFLPTLVGGALLSGVADRVPRRAVMIVSDVVRGVLFAAMALPQLSLVVTSVLLVVAVLLDSPFRAAQTATIPDVLVGPVYSAGIALRTISLQTAQLAGYAVGGLLAGAVSPRFGLAVNAATFLLSAILIRLEVQARPVPSREQRESPHVRDYFHGIGDGVMLILRSPRLRTLAGLAVLSGFYVVPEGLAAPYAATLGGGSTAVGLLMAADPAGSAVGAWLLVRFVPETLRGRWMAVLAIGPGLVLATLLWRPGLPISFVLWFATGVLCTFQIPASVEFVTGLPDNQRGQALGIVISGMLTAQGLGVLASGVIASATDPTVSIVAFGLLGSAMAALLAWRWRSARHQLLVTRN